MTINKSMPPQKKPYCTAPWMEVHLNYNGETRPCDHNQTDLGNWQQNGLKSVWEGEPYQKFRGAIAAGEYPSEQCRSCHLNGTTSNLYNSTQLFVNSLRQRLLQKIPRELPSLGKLMGALQQNEISWNELEGCFTELMAELSANKNEKINVTLETEISHIHQLAEITKSYFLGSPNPKIVGPIRQARLINKCNARCVMCAGKFNGDIVNGPGMDPVHLSEALHGAEHILSFSSEASEFLLFTHWKEIVEALSRSGLPKLRLFTNGMLLTKENTKFLIDNHSLEMLLISMNAASKETLEEIQVNVKYQRLLDNIRFLLSYAEEKKSHFQLTFSFIVMKRNFHEIPDFIELVHQLTKDHPNLNPVVFFPFLESNNELPAYREFLFEEHHSLVDPKKLLGAFKEAHILAKRYGIFATLKEESLEQYVNRDPVAVGLPVKEADMPILLAKHGTNLPLLKALVPSSEAARLILEQALSHSQVFHDLLSPETG